MADGEMIFNFFSNVNKNKEAHMAELAKQQGAPQLRTPLPSTAPLRSAINPVDDIRKKNIEQLRQNAVAPKPTVIQNHYETPHAFPNSRTSEERGIPQDSTNPHSHGGIPTSPTPSAVGEKVNLTQFFKYGSFRK